MAKVKYMFVDGYNVINQWEMLKNVKDDNLEYARDKLIDMLQEYATINNVNVVVVFDAHLQKGNVENRITVGKIEVVFTKEGETADCFIERNVPLLSKKGQVAVVTSDYIEQRITLQMGGLRMTPNELWYEIKLLEKNIEKKKKISYADEVNRLSDIIDKDILEKLEKIRRKH